MREIDVNLEMAHPVTGRLAFWKERPDSEYGKWMFVSADYQATDDLQKGLWKIRNGDHLVIKDKDQPEQIVWEGTVYFEPHLQMGYPAKKCQKGLDAHTWMRWFRAGFPAILTPGSDLTKYKTERLFDRTRQAASNLPARYQHQLAEELGQALKSTVRPGEGQVYEGVLEDFFEQGSEAHSWLLFRDEDPRRPDLQGYGRLVALDEGDYLEILDARGRTLWGGVIAHDTASGQLRVIQLKHGGTLSVTWLQADVDPDQWVHFFNNGYRARLTKPAPGGRSQRERNTASEDKHIRQDGEPGRR